MLYLLNDEEFMNIFYNLKNYPWIIGEQNINLVGGIGLARGDLIEYNSALGPFIQSSILVSFSK